MKKWPTLILAVMWCFLAGCDNGTGGNPDTGELTNVEAVEQYLDKQDGTDPDNPVKLAVKVDADEWWSLFLVIDQADKFVALDLSRCYNVPLEFSSIAAHRLIVSIVLPRGITSIRRYAFYSSQGDTVLRHVDLPAGLKTIGENAFCGCTSLTEIDLPASLTAIGGSAFTSCPNLSRVICLATTPPQMPYMAFDNWPDDPVVIEVPAASVAAYKAAWIYCAHRIRSM